MAAFTGRFPEDARYDESPYAAAVAETRGPRPARARRHRRRRLHRHRSRTSSTTSTTPPPARARSRSTWSPRAAASTRKVILGGQGGDEIFGGYTRYLIAYFEQCIKAAIDGTERRRQLRRHLRVDHPQPRVAARLQAAAEGVLARGAVRGPRRALLPPHQPGPRPRRRGSNRGARRLLAVRDLPRDLQRRQRRPRVLLRQDDPLRLQDAAAGAAAGRGPRLDGARARVARAVAGPPRWSSWRRRCRPNVKFKDGHDEARVPRGHSRDRSAAGGRRSQGQDGLPGAADEWMAGPAQDFVTDVLSSQAARRARAVRQRPVVEGMTARRRFGRRRGACCRWSSGSGASTTAQAEFQGMLTEEEVTL